MPSVPFDRAAARRHLEQLAIDHSVFITWVRGWTLAEAWPGQRAAALPYVRTARDYLVGLHELGHVLSPHARGLTEAGVLYDEISCEGYAWAWAATHADPQLARTISAKEWALAYKSFGSYLRHAATWDGVWPRYLPAEAG